MGQYDDLIYAKRPVSMKHARMKKIDRAKQFAPFAALKGYEEALRKKEVEFVPRKVLSESRKEELDSLLRQVQIGDIIQVVYYSNGNYRTIRGSVCKIDQTSRILMVDESKIPIDTIDDMKDDLSLMNPL